MTDSCWASRNTSSGCPTYPFINYVLDILPVFSVSCGRTPGTNTRCWVKILENELRLCVGIYALQATAHLQVLNNVHYAPAGVTPTKHVCAHLPLTPASCVSGWMIFFCCMLASFTTDIFNSSFNDFSYKGIFGLFVTDKYIIFKVSSSATLRSESVTLHLQHQT